VKSSRFQMIGIVSAAALLSTAGLYISDTADRQAATGEDIAHPTNSCQCNDAS